MGRRGGQRSKKRRGQHQPRQGRRTQSKGRNPSWKDYHAPKRSGFGRAHPSVVAPKKARKPSKRLKSVSSIPTPEHRRGALLPSRVPRQRPRRAQTISLATLYARNLRTRALPWFSDLHGWLERYRNYQNELLVGLVVVLPIVAAALWILAPHLLVALLALLALVPLHIALRETQRQNRLLTDGVVRQGQIVHIRVPRHNPDGPRLVTFAYKDLNGERRTHTERLHVDEPGGRVHNRSRFDVLVHPDHDGVVVPYLYGISFEETKALPAPQTEPEPTPAAPAAQDEPLEETPLEDFAQIEDERPSALDEPGPGELAPPSGSLLLHRRAPAGGLWGWLQSWWASDTMGALHSDPEHLTLEVPNKTVRLSWSQPWIVHVSARLMPQHMVELNLSIRQTGAKGRQEAIKFKALLPQGTVHRNVPIKWEACPYVRPDDMTTLWQALRNHAASHGRTLTGHAPAQPTTPS